MGRPNWGAIIWTTSAMLATIVATRMATKRRRREATHLKIRDTLSLKISDSLFVLKEPKPPVTPSMDILFFHGFHSSDSCDSHLRTWEIQLEDGPCIWPSSWLVERFPNARILYVSYNAILGKISHGKPDLHVIGENLASDLMLAKIGQTPNCPVILVGHCFGGIVIKQLCLYMKSQAGLAREDKRKKLEDLLRRIKGVFYYGTPHRGSSCVENAENLHTEPLLKYFRLLSTEACRINEDFAHLRNHSYPDWRIQGLGEGLPTNQGLFHGVIVAQEACSRDGDDYNVVPADHVSITKPDSKTDRRFNALVGLLHSVVYDAKVEVVGHQCVGLPIYPAELENRAKEVEDKLKNLSILGIFGMGGIGKTTLAKQVYNNISKEFEYTAFLDNVKGQNELQDWALSKFYRKGNRVDRIRWADMRGKKTFIVMDDVDAEDQLTVFPELHHFGSGSKMILTSRDQQISRFYENCEIYDVHLLKPDVAKKLFCKHAFDQEDIAGPTKNLEEHVTAVVEKCGGLPLTLEVIGRYLRRNTNAKIWKETIRKLGKAQAINGAQKDAVWARLKVSYDALAEEEKEMFLEAGTIFFGKKLDFALAAWSTGIGEPETRWANLVGRSMVKENGSRVWVHEHLRDLAKSLAKNSVISGELEEDELLKILHSEEGKKETKALWLSRSSQHSSIQVDSLAELENLKYLDVVGGMREGKVGEKWLRRLSMLSIDQLLLRVENMFPFSLSEMKNLAVLKLTDGDVPKGFSESLGNLTNLRILALSRLRGLDSLSENFGNLSQLKALILRGLRLLKLPESLGQLAALEELTLYSLPCSELPESTGNLSSLRTLTLTYCRALECLPRSFSRCLGLEALHIRGCDRLKELGDSFGDLPALRLLTLHECGLERLPESFGRLSALEELKLGRIDLSRLPDTTGQLINLRSLHIDAARIETLPESFGRLSALEELKLSSMVLLTRLPDTIGQLINLRSFHIDYAGIEILPESFGLLASLQKLIIIDCKNLEELPKSLGLLASLQELSIEHNNLKALPKSFAGLGGLKKVSLWEDRIKALPYGFGKHCSVLEELKIKGYGLKSLPVSMEQLSSLQSLVICCRSLKKLPDIFWGLSFSLKELHISASSLKNLPESIGRLQSMQKFVLYAKSVKTRPESLGQLSSLKEMTFSCKGIERLPKHFNHLPLSSLALTLDCCSSGLLPDGVGELSTLADLTVQRFQLKTLPDELGKLSSLRRLKFDRCDFESLPESLGCLSSLSEMELLICHKLETLPDTLRRPSVCPVAPPQEERMKESIVENASSHPTATKGLRLVIEQCKFLDESRMRSFGWVLEEAVAQSGWRKVYRRENPCSGPA